MNGVLALTERRLLELSGKDLAYVLPASNINSVELKAGKSGGKALYHVVVRWSGGTLIHQSIKNLTSNDFLSVTTSEQQDAQFMVNAIRRVANLA